MWRGAVLRADDIVLAIGGNLTLASRQDTHHGSNASVNGQASATLGIVGPSSASLNVGMGQGSSDGKWVTEQTGLFARNKLHAYVAKHTQIDGAVLNSATGDLKLDTGTLAVTTIKDHDTGTQINAQVGLTTPGAPGKLPGVNLQGSYATHDTEQETRGTIGKGEVVIRDGKKQKQDVASINRDPEKAQEITKDERAGVKLHASSGAIAEVAKGIDFAGKTLGQAVQSLVEAQVAQGQISKEEGRTLKTLTSAALSDKKIRTAIDTCASSGVGCSLSINEQIIKLDPKTAQRASDTIVVAGNSGTPGNNQAQNKQVKAIVVELNLTQDQQKRLHKLISGENFGFQEIRAILLMNLARNANNTIMRIRASEHHEE